MPHDVLVLHLLPLDLLLEHPWEVPHVLAAGAGVSEGGGLKPGTTGQGVVSRADPAGHL